MMPEGWRDCSYQDVAEINRNTISSKVNPSETIRYIDIAAVSATNHIESPKEMTLESAPSRARRKVFRGDCILSTVRPYLKAFAYIDGNDERLVASTGFAVLSAKNKVDAKFLFQTLLRDTFISDLCSKMKGSNYPAVSAADIAECRLLLPPLPEQRAIAEILDSVDTTISATEATLAQTRRVKQALLQQLLTKGIDENGRPHTKFKMTEIGEIPEGWEVVQLQSLFSHIVDCLHSTPAYCEMGIPAIRTADVVPGRILVDQCYLVSEESYSERTKRLVPREGDIFYSREGERFGIAAPVPADSRMCLAQRMMHFRAKEGIDSLFALWLLNSRLVYDQATAVASQQTSPHLNIGAIKKFVVRIPPHDEQQAIGKTIDSVTKAERRLEVKIDTCDRLKRALMRDLLTGRVRVKDVKL